MSDFDFGSFNEFFYAESEGQNQDDIMDVLSESNDDQIFKFGHPNILSYEPDKINETGYSTPIDSLNAFGDGNSFSRNNINNGSNPTYSSIGADGSILMNQQFVFSGASNFNLGAPPNYTRNLTTVPQAGLQNNPYLPQNYPSLIYPISSGINRKYIYGKGCEVQKMTKKYSNYKKNYKDCQVYKGFNMPNKEFLINLGKDYNIQYQKSIKYKRMPKFKRDFGRNKGLAVWFFEDILPTIRPWLVEAKNFQFK